MQVVGVHWYFLGILEWGGRLLSFILKTVMVVSGVLIIVFAHTDWDRERRESSLWMKKPSLPQGNEGKKRGGGEIRTPGTFQYDGFQDRSIKPLWHSSGGRLQHHFYMNLSIALQR